MLTFYCPRQWYFCNIKAKLFILHYCTSHSTHIPAAAIKEMLYALFYIWFIHLHKIECTLEANLSQLFLGFPNLWWHCLSWGEGVSAKGRQPHFLTEWEQLP